MTTATAPRVVSGAKAAAARLSRLRELASQAGPALYERVQLARQLIDDRDFVLDRYKGDQSAAMDAVESTYFADIGGLISLPRLLDIARAFPEEKAWKDARYNVRALLSMYLDRQREESEESAPKSRKPRTTAEMLEKAEAAHKVAEDRLIRTEQDRETFKSEVDRLRLENAELRGRIVELEKTIAMLRK